MINTTWLNYLLLLVVLVGFGAPVMGAADNSDGLNRRNSGAEQLFEKGVGAYRDQDFSRAAGLFEKVVDLYPDTTRGKDALYYLDRLKLHGHRTKFEPPAVRVLLSETKSISGEVLARADLRDARGRNLKSLKPGQSWRVNFTEAGVDFRLGGESYRRSKLSLVPRSEEGAAFRVNEVDYRGRLGFISSTKGPKTINKVGLNNYLYGVVRKETAPGWQLEAYKAQAVASRSMAVNAIVENRDRVYDVAPDQSFQSYEGHTAETSQARKAVELTKGEVLISAGRVVPAFFHSNSGGHIESGRHVWSGKGFEFIKPRPDTWSLDTENSSWELKMEVDEINRALRSVEFPPLASSASLSDSKKLPSGRALELKYRTASGKEVEVDANKFRIAVGGGRLRSTWFKEIKNSYGEIYFSGRGWGHGVGMSQWGAKEMVEAGHSYDEVLNFYYARARLVANYGPAYHTLKAFESLSSGQ